MGLVRLAKIIDTMREPASVERNHGAADTERSAAEPLQRSDADRRRPDAALVEE